MTELILMQLLVCAVQYFIATSESIKKIFVVTLLFNTFNLLCYYLNGDMATVYSYLVICVRSVVYIYRDSIKKYKWHFLVPILAITVQTAVGFSAIENPWQLLPIIAPCYVNYYLWFYKSTQKLRLGNIANNSLWGIYNFATGLWIIGIVRIITVGMNAVSFTKHRKLEQTKQ